ncbi:MAG: ATP-binding protein [Planctomycetales bacterium]|nr:ATP-binding protein [Planctomycetales bacterium]
MNLTDTRLYQRLTELCDQRKTGVLDKDLLLGMVKRATTELATLLNRACLNFEDYTLHDEDHALRVISLMYRLMGGSVTQKLNAVELTLLILSAYAHDIGMSSAREKRDKLRESSEYRDFLLRNERAWEEAEQAKELRDLERFEFRQSMLFQDFLRLRHHLISAELVEGELQELFVINGSSFASYLATLCTSHGQDMGWVARIGLKPFATEFMVDLPFLACVLRLADYLDLDAARAPHSLFALIRPGNEVSRREWRKHQAAKFYVDSDKIVFDASFDDFFEEKALRDTLKGIERERRDIMEFLQQRRGDGLHTLSLRAKVSVSIESKGYCYEEFRFQLEYREIMSLLMGVRLYRDERVFLRELLQNALDACRHADAAASKAGRQDYKGRITVRRAREGGREILEVSDNGAGMTRTIIRDYFMRVGRSYYHSFAFKRRALDLYPVSQFGIGILSCFMKGSQLEVETSPDRNVYADAPPEDLVPRRLDIHGPHEFFVVHEVPDLPTGTTIRVFLDQPLPESLKGLVARFAGRLPYTIEIQDGQEPSQFFHPTPFDFDNDRFRSGFASFPGAFGYQHRDLEFNGRLGFDLSGKIRFFLLDAGSRRHLRLTNAGPYAEVGFSEEGETLLVVKHFDENVQNTVQLVLEPVRAAHSEATGELRADLENLLRNLDLVCEHLLHRHDSSEIEHRWSSVIAQRDALTQSANFRVHPLCVGLATDLQRATGEIESFVSGRLTLSPPNGFVTQDGINVTGIARLPSRLKLGIGYFYNIDLCGPHRLSLTASRDQIVEDECLAHLTQYLHKEIGRFLGSWFRDESFTAEEVSEYVAAVPRTLGDAAKRAFLSSEV